MTIGYQECIQCVMDTTDPDIVFDERGFCHYCVDFKNSIQPNWHTDERGVLKLSDLADKIRYAGRGKDFDCIIGLSGGLDSSYTAYVAKEIMGLRPLLFHVDAGWNTDQAVSNIEKLVDGLGVELYTEVINWEDVKNFQLAFLRSQIVDQDLVQDAAFFSALYKFARKHKVKYVLTGSNYSTECCREPELWGGYPGLDKRLFNDIYKKFGTNPIKNFPLLDILVYKGLYQGILGMRVIKPLNFVSYKKKEAENELERRFGWKRFQHKHHESRFTRFYEDYWMPRKFGFDRRRAHFSSLILTGQMKREDALIRLAKPEMDDHFMLQEFEYVANKLGLSIDQLNEIFLGENKTYRDYRNKRWVISLGAKLLRALGFERRMYK